MLQRLIGEHIEVRLALDPTLARVKADPAQLEQVLLNLGINARDAMPRGGWLTFSTANIELGETFTRQHPGAPRGPHVMLTVADTGVGMDAEVRAHLFEPFFTTKEPGKGTGLGLATVYGIVKQHDGYISVHSEPGHGATFRIYLPRVEDPPPTVKAVSDSAEGLRGSETILIVEDEQNLLDLTRETLETQGYRVLAARDPVEALDLSNRHAGKIHLLITDVIMPDMNGRELADRLVGVCPGLKVLYISGYTQDLVGQPHLGDQAMVLLEKPLAPGALVRKVREILDAPPAPSKGTKNRVNGTIV
jgi:CheY-like chemotaxis protein